MCFKMYETELKHRKKSQTQPRHHGLEASVPRTFIMGYQMSYSQGLFQTREINTISMSKDYFFFRLDRLRKNLMTTL